MLYLQEWVWFSLLIKYLHSWLRNKPNKENAIELKDVLVAWGIKSDVTDGMWLFNTEGVDICIQMISRTSSSVWYLLF